VVYGEVQWDGQIFNMLMYSAGNNAQFGTEPLVRHVKLVWSHSCGLKPLDFHTKTVFPWVITHPNTHTALQ
jgi:hypothetical protein